MLSDTIVSPLRMIRPNALFCCDDGGGAVLDSSSSSSSSPPFAPLLFLSFRNSSAVEREGMKERRQDRQRQVGLNGLS